MYLFIALITGGLIILSMIINASLSNRIGVVHGTAINYIVGLIFSIILFVIMDGENITKFSELIKTPKYYLIGGTLGVLVIIANNIIIPKIPVVYTTILAFTGQIITGIIIDYFRFGVFSEGKTIGAILIIIGLFYNMRVDRKVSDTI